jgi:hypothetical protein
MAKGRRRKDGHAMTETITNQDAQYAWDIVKTICTDVGPGSPGSSQEWNRAAVLKKELELHLGNGCVVAEEFTVAPGALLGAQRLSGLFMLVAALLSFSMGRFAGISPWPTAVAAVAFSILSALIYVLEFIYGFELVDPLFKKQQSVDVIGALRKPGTQNVKRLLLLSGHHDSALENTWLRYLGYGTLILSGIFFVGVITTLVMSALQLAGVIGGSAVIVRAGTMGWAALAFLVVPSVIYAVFFTMGGQTVPGAVDNLSASALAVAMCRFLVRNPSCVPEDTEIRFVSFGSEEAGLRGSRRYVERHLDELRRLDARLLNYEMVAHPEITILTSDVNGTVKNSPELVRTVVAAAERAGVPHKVAPAHLGIGTDAGPFSKAGLKAAALLPFKEPQQLVAFYHTRRDAPDVLTIEPLLNVLKLTLEWVLNGGE